jgi:hypothetical protein
MKTLRGWAALLTGIAAPALAFAQMSMPSTYTAQQSAGNAGVSAIWVLANLCYAGMKAQAHPSVGWRMVSFIFGFPGTLISFLVVTEGSERAYGVDLPRKR